MFRKKILLADDPELLGVVENSFFRRIGFTLLVAASGEQALELIEEQDPSLAILTLDMPGLDGDSICRQVKKDAILRSTPVILLASSGDDRGAVRCRKAGCDEILLRPVDSQRMLAAACRVLNIVNRGAPRAEISLPVLCGRDPRKMRSGRALNLNCGGLFLETDRLHPIDTLLTLEFTLPEQTSRIHCKGRVAWVNHPEWLKTLALPNGMGMQFLDLSGEAEVAIRRYIEKRPLFEDADWGGNGKLRRDTRFLV